MKRFITTLSFLLAAGWAHGQLNMQLRAVVHDTTVQLANVGGYVDSLGHEYALVGTSAGLTIVDVTSPASPLTLFQVPGVTSNWREVKTWLHYAYVTNENGGGLQIINLQYLPDSIQVRQWNGDSLVTGLQTAHALHIDSGFLYLYGCGTGPLMSDPMFFNGAAIICDLLTDPWEPHYLGHTTDFGGVFNSYVHDGFVYGDTLWAGHIWAGVVQVWDCSNKALPVLLATQLTPGAFTHNTWLSDDHSTLFTTDEVAESFVTAYDVTDISNITRLSKFQTKPGSQCIVHNTHIVNDYAVTSWYTEGVVITDVSRPANPIEVGKYDTNADTGLGTIGCWGAYPFLPSGTILASDIANGLFILTPTYVRGCYLEGMVTDSVTGFPIQNVRVTIDTTGAGTLSAITGDYKTGLAAAGLYTVTFSRTGYVSKSFPVTLTNGVLTTLNVELAQIGAGFQLPDPETCISIFPNPAASAFSIRYEFGAGQGPFNIRLNDAIGRHIGTYPLAGQAGTWQGNILSPGMYFIILEAEGYASRPFRIVIGR